MKTNPLTELHKYGQSVWYDQMRRALLTGGELKRMIDEDDLRGVTSNPTIFEKAIGGSTDYDEALGQLAHNGASVNDIYEALVVDDIGHAADLFLPVYQKTEGVDGYISLEVSPALAHDTEGTIASAKSLFARLNRPNVMIKIPATPEGLPAIEEAIAAGLNVNVTLIFAQDVYAAVAEAYIRGLERRMAAGQPIDRIASVASFFVSRIDTAVDKQLEERIREAKTEDERSRLESLLGKTAIANAKMAYQKYKEIFEGERFAQVRAKGARPQRQLWASTGTKNPKFSDVLYVESLIGPETVNTVPPETLNAFRDHGRVRPTLEEGIEEAGTALQQLTEVGISLEAVTTKLTAEGVKSFADSFDKLIAVIKERRDAVTQNQVERRTAKLGRYEKNVADTLKRMEEEKFVSRMTSKDASLWKSEEAHEKIIRNSLGWLTVVEQMQKQAKDLKEFAGEVRSAGFEHVVVLGMGGSSLCPEVLRQTFGKLDGFPELHVLDSTVPAAVRLLEDQIDVAKTLFIVASKSGSTVEPQMFYRYFLNRVREAKGAQAGENFIAITDPDTQLAAEANSDGFRRVFLNPADIGGRYSALSFFGMVPAALMGVDVEALLDRALEAVNACSEVVPVQENPGARLAAILGALTREGRDKVTLITPPPLGSLGLWIEQLVAESTGKEGRGILPIAGEPLGSPDVYGDDRVFVLISIENSTPAEILTKLGQLEHAGYPVVRHTLQSPLDLGEEFFVWEFATALAGALLQINSFDQPNVQESKDNTRALLREFSVKGELPQQTVISEDGAMKIYVDEATTQSLGRGSTSRSTLGETFARHLASVKAGDYVALLAYIGETPEHNAALEAIQAQLRDGLRVATTVGYGPRFLHSTGQLHKGGAGSGVFIQITADDSADLQIPGEPFTFGVLKAAQALGDFQALASRERRAIRVHLGQNTAAGLKQLHALVREATTKQTEATAAD